LLSLFVLVVHRPMLFSSFYRLGPTGGENNTQMHCVLVTDDVTIMTSSPQKFPRRFRIKLSTKRVFQIFDILGINGIAPFCELIYQTTLVIFSPLSICPFARPLYFSKSYQLISMKFCFGGKCD